MISFFLETLKARLNQNKDKYPLLKLNDLLDWQSIEKILKEAQQRQNQNKRGRPSYEALKMFKAVLLGQWHNLSDPELEHALIVRSDFVVFCDFDDMELPDHSTLCRYRNWLICSGLLKPLLDQINAQLSAKHLKINRANVAVVDASIISSIGAPSRKAFEVDESSNEVTEIAVSKDKDARWVKKAGHFYLGYKLHACSDEDGYIDQIHVTAANAHEAKHLEPVTQDLNTECCILSDKGYASLANRRYLSVQGYQDGIMHKAFRNKALTTEQKNKNNTIKRKRYVIEQSFGTLKRRFQFRKAKYFGLEKVLGQSYLKVMCLNLLKAMNKVSYV